MTRLLGLTGRQRISFCGLVCFTAGVGAAGIGCSQANVKIETWAALSTDEGSQQRIAADPMGFLRHVLEETRKIETFQAEFKRQERLGLIPVLKPAERMIAEHREEPFSVRFTWIGDDSDYLQCLYVGGQNDGKVLLLPRRGLLGFPPSVQKYPPEWAVLFHKARNPITDFGPRRMIERTLDRIEKARPHGEVSIQLAGAAEVGADKTHCYHFVLRYPKGDEFPCKLQDLYIHIDLRLPVATRLWLTEGEERTEKTLDGEYLYSDMRINLPLPDERFVIDAGKPSKGNTTSNEPAKPAEKTIALDGETTE